MRRQRFAGSSFTAPFRNLFRGKFAQFIVFFSLWNGAFYGVYKLAQGGARNKDPDFDNKPQVEQVLAMQGFKTENIKQYKISITEKGIKTETKSAVVDQE